MTESRLDTVLAVPGDAAPVTPVFIVRSDHREDDLAGAPEPVKAWAEAARFDAKPGSFLLAPGADGSVAAALYGVGKEAPLSRIGELPKKAPNGGVYALTGAPIDGERAVLHWLLGAYRFERYKKAPKVARLSPPEGVDLDRVKAIAAGVYRTRDLVNTPAGDMGPQSLATAALDLAEHHGARCEVIEGEALLTQNFPMIHAVGRAAAEAPRLIDLTWGAADAPKVTLVGKGVCFDTGGLDIKPARFMRNMKKDMGGAATVLGLADMIMATALPVRLRVLIPAVENAVGPDAFRPGDVLTGRNGLTVEIGDTDAEGRLVLADALVEADHENPDLLMDFATLTGAARVAVGPDIAPFYTPDDALAEQIAEAAERVGDPVWRMPLWAGYDQDLSSKVADLCNISSGSYAGSITAALFLKRFVDQTPAYAHFDIFAWNPKTKPGRPEGGECQAARAVFDMLSMRYGA
ncbi:MAG: leucyl aminopeptidase family protein [Pseudomonadota bacterium]